MLPWVSAQRQKMRDDGAYEADGYLRCESCRGYLVESQRREWNCGFEPVPLRTGVAPTPPRAPGATVCPGYTTSLPEVGEAARALGWADRGMLKEFYSGDELPPVLFDCLDILAMSLREVEADGYREIKERSKSGG